MSKELGNIQHSTFDVQHRMGRQFADHLALNVECWLLNVPTASGGFR